VLAPETLDEVRAVLAVIEHREGGDVHAAAVRLAALVRREALDDRNLLALVRDDEPELAPALARLCLRRATSPRTSA
jgi:hypothetical protein